MKNSFIWIGVGVWYIGTLLLMCIVASSPITYNNQEEVICGTILAKLSDSDIVIQTTKGKKIITLTDETYKRSEVKKYICVNKIEE